MIIFPLALFVGSLVGIVLIARKIAINTSYANFVNLPILANSIMWLCTVALLSGVAAIGIIIRY